MKRSLLIAVLAIAACAGSCPAKSQACGRFGHRLRCGRSCSAADCVARRCVWCGRFASDVVAVARVLLQSRVLRATRSSSCIQLRNRSCPAQ